MQINITAIKYGARSGGPVTVFVSDQPGYLLETNDVAYSIAMIAGRSGEVVIAGDDPLHQPAAVAHLLRSLRSMDNVRLVSLRTKHGINALSDHLSPAWIWMDEIITRLDVLIAAGEVIRAQQQVTA